MIITKLSHRIDKEALLHKVGSTHEGASIMIEKMGMHYFYLKDLRTPAANILKQDALSIGAELAVEKDTILCKDEHVDAVLIVNDKQLRILAKKELAQPFGLKTLAKTLKSYQHIQQYPAHIMGVLNINEDSFFDKSRSQLSTIASKIETMIEEGAAIIDIGAVSSRPGSKGISEEEELERLRDIVDLIAQEAYHDRVRFSLDSYAPKPIAYALERGFRMVNDITGLADDNVCALVAEYQASVVVMHMQGTPQDMQNNPQYEDVIAEVDSFFAARLQKAAHFGIKDVILDIGLGFGKSLQHNLLLLKHLGHFSHFKKALLVGASRKSMIDKIQPTPIQERLPATLALHMHALDEGASILRVHDVKEHQQMLSVYNSMKDIMI